MNKLQWKFSQNSCIFIHENAIESVVCEMAAMLSRPQCVKNRVHKLLEMDENGKWMMRWMAIVDQISIVLDKQSFVILEKPGTF